MSESEDLSRQAGKRFGGASATAFEDAQLRKFRYHLLRLTNVGLTKQDVEDFVELGRLAFQDGDVAEQAAKIKQRADASPLAFAIADIVDFSVGGGRGRVHPKALLFGAVLGAYTGLHQPTNTDLLSVSIHGAIGGAVAMSTNAFVEDIIDTRSVVQLSSAGRLSPSTSCPRPVGAGRREYSPPSEPSPLTPFTTSFSATRGDSCGRRI